MNITQFAPKTHVSRTGQNTGQSQPARQKLKLAQNNQKSVLLISFDIRRPGEPIGSYAVASLKASLLGSCAVQRVDTVSVAVPYATCNFSIIINELHRQGAQDWGAYDTIAVSAYVWSDDWTRKFIRWLRREGFCGKIVLGGYRISYAELEELIPDYPETDIFLSMHAEASLIEAVRMPKPTQPVLLKAANYPVDFDALPPIYASGLLPVADSQGMVRMETKRGCPMRCTFCQYRDWSGTKKKVHRIDLDRTSADLIFLSQKNVGKINFSDPIFNLPNSQYIELVQLMKASGMRSLLSLQIRPEYLVRLDGLRFLDLVSEMNVVLEFGLQTAIPEENQIIDRQNDYEKIEKAIELVHERQIPFEINLIYGLPRQTIDSFQHSIDYCLALNPTRLIAFPLMLHKGTPLYHQRKRFGFQEEVVGEFNILLVTASHSFTRNQWQTMHEMAEHINRDYELRRVI